MDRKSPFITENLIKKKLIKYKAFDTQFQMIFLESDPNALVHGKINEKRVHYPFIYNENPNVKKDI